MNWDLVLRLVVSSPLGVVHFLGGPLVFRVFNLDAALVVVMLSAPPLSNDGRIVCGLAFPGLALNLTRAKGRRCSVLERFLTEWPRTRFVIGNKSSCMLSSMHLSKCLCDGACLCSSNANKSALLDAIS